MNLPGLRKTLASLPKTLNDTYVQILCNIDEGHFQYAFKILQWLAYSAWPLELKEVAEVITIDIEGSPRFAPENIFRSLVTYSRYVQVLFLCRSTQSRTNTVTVIGSLFGWPIFLLRSSYPQTQFYTEKPSVTAFKRLTLIPQSAMTTLRIFWNSMDSVV